MVNIMTDSGIKSGWIIYVSTTLWSCYQQCAVNAASSEMLETHPLSSKVDPIPCNVTEGTIDHSVTGYIFICNASCPQCPKMRCKSKDFMDILDKYKHVDKHSIEETSLAIDNFELAVQPNSRQGEINAFDSELKQSVQSSRNKTFATESFDQITCTLRCRPTSVESTLNYRNLHFDGCSVVLKTLSCDIFFQNYSQPFQLTPLDLIIDNCRQDGSSVVMKVEQMTDHQNMTVGIFSECRPIHDKLLEMCLKQISLKNAIDSSLSENLAESFTKNLIYDLVRTACESLEEIVLEDTDIRNVQMCDNDIDTKIGCETNIDLIGSKGKSNNFQSVANEKCLRSNSSFMRSGPIGMGVDSMSLPEYRYQPIDLNSDIYQELLKGHTKSSEAPQKGILFRVFYWSYVTAFLYVACYLTGTIMSQFSVPGLVMKIILIHYFPDIIKLPMFRVVDLVLSGVYSLM